MALDKVIDSAQLDADLTAVADAIRSKTGKTDKLTLEQMPGEIEGIEAGGGGGGADSPVWSVRIYEIEIGANNIKNSQDVSDYMISAVDSIEHSIVILKSPLTVDNQLVFCGLYDVPNSKVGLLARWRGGNIMTTSVGTNYDMFIVEGTKYIVYEEAH